MNANKTYFGLDVSMLKLAGVSLFLPAFGGVVSHLFFPGELLISIPIHSVIEALGAFSALSLAALLLLIGKNRDEIMFSVWIASGLIGMGILDGVHSCVAPGTRFVWLHSIATLCGGLLFALSWLPKRITRSRIVSCLPAVVAFSASIAGLASFLFPALLPAMVNNGAFTSVAKSINVAGGLFFIAAAFNFIILNRTSTISDESMFVTFCIFSGFGGLLFPLSALWDVDWWFWHLLRLMAYFLAFRYIFLVYARGQRALKEHQDSLETLVQKRTIELQKAEETFRDLFDNANDGMIVAEQDRNFSLVNKKISQMLGYTQAELTKLSIMDIHPEEEMPSVIDIFEKQRRGEIESAIQPMKRKDGSVFYAEVTAKPIQISGVAKMLGMFRDITGRKLAEDEIRNMMHTLETQHLELEAAYQELKHAQSKLMQQEKMASVGQLAAGIAHEINNPTGFIISNLRSLQKYADRVTEFIRIQSEALANLPSEDAETVEKQRKSLKVDYIIDDLRNLVKESLDGADRIKKIVQDLKSFSRVDEAELKMADINIGIESTINIVWNELKYKATVKKEYGDIPQIRCNPGQLNQVFMNILVNAAHAIEKQGEIRIRTWQKDGGINVSIADTGSGIPKDKLSRIFEPFFTTKEVGKGTGLGLSIAYDIVKKHKGSIEVESEVGKGTIFTVKIPVTEA